MLDFCAEKGIVAEIEMTPVQKIEKPTAAWRRATSSIAS
jgi:hypothetical protein